jgi:hypothetical protein
MISVSGTSSRTEVRWSVTFLTQLDLLPQPSIAPTQADHSQIILGRALAQCLQESDCIMVQRHSPRECLSSPLAEELPTKCQQLRKGFGECK